MKLFLGILQAIVDLIYPPVCLHCGMRITRQKNYLCSTCEAEMQPIPEPQCPVCGFTVLGDKCQFCDEHENHLPYDRAVSLYKYEGPARTLIHNLKFGDMPGIASYLSRKMLSFLEENRLFLDANMITAIPLHPVRKRERGYNQAALLAQDIAKSKAWDFHEGILHRKRATLPQANLAKAKRFQNVENAFKLKKTVDLKQENIVLLDDVFTTGATVEAACNELRKSRPAKIYVITVGRA